MKRILINATHNEEIRVALCQGKHMYDFDLENRTREQKKANIYKAHVTRVEPSLEAVFVEYGAKRQGFLPVREIAKEYLSGNPRTENIRNLIKEGDTLIVQVEKEERSNKGAALSTYISLAGRYLVLMPNNPRGGGISRQISGKMRDDMKRMVSSLDLPSDMSVIIRTAGIGRTQEDLQHDLNHLLNIWQAVREQNKKYASPLLMHQEAGVVTRALRDYLTDDISEIWIDSEEAYNEASNFIQSVMPKQLHKLRKYTNFEPMLARFGIEKQIETAYQREVRLPSGGSIVIDQTEAMVAIDINSAKSNKGADISETAYHTNLEAAEEIARQLRLRDMGGLIVIDFIDMSDHSHQKEVEKRLLDATKYDRARIQFTEISKFGLLEMSRQRLRPSLEESTGYKCPRCHGNGMIRDLRSLSLSIMRQIEQIALTNRAGELQAEVPNDIAAFLLNEKRDSLVYLEQDSGTRITILTQDHMESPDYQLHYNPEGFAPSSYERINDSETEQTSDIGYNVDWQTKESKVPKQQPTRQLRNSETEANKPTPKTSVNQPPQSSQRSEPVVSSQQPEVAAWLSNLFAPTPQAKTAETFSTQQVVQGIEDMVNSGRESLGSVGQVNKTALPTQVPPSLSDSTSSTEKPTYDRNKRLPSRKPKHDKDRYKKDRKSHQKYNKSEEVSDSNEKSDVEKNKPESIQKDNRKESSRNQSFAHSDRSLNSAEKPEASSQTRNQIKEKAPPRKALQTSEQETNSVSRVDNKSTADDKQATAKKPTRPPNKVEKSSSFSNGNKVALQVIRNQNQVKDNQVVHLSLDTSKPVKLPPALQAQLPKNPPVAKKIASDEISPSVVTETAKTPVKTSAINQRDADVKVVEKKQKAPLRADGRAINDPRVVRESLVKSRSTSAQKPTTPAERLTVTGTVGEFLRNTLDNAEERLQKDSVIACFIEAVDKVNQPENADHSEAQAEPSLSFDFSNYGYSPLSDDYLRSFNGSIRSVGQCSMVQGKTSVEPTAITKRASNDPRGQSEEYLANLPKEEEAPSVDEPSVIDQPPVEILSTDVVGDLAEQVSESLEKGVVESSAVVEDSAGESGIEEATPVDSPLVADQPEETQSDSDSDQDDTSDDSDNDNTASSTESQKSQERDSVQDEKVNNEADTDDHKERPKTTFDKYKSMLANVSEQLSTTPSGINSLFLSTPTVVPKTRTRKK